MDTIRSSLKNELRYNLTEAWGHLEASFTLLDRYIRGSVVRTQERSYQEYDACWNRWWEAEYSRRDAHSWTRNGVPVTMSALEYHRDVEVAMVCRRIEEANATSVLEIGSGVGVNLMLLAPLFPHVQFYGLEPTESGVRCSREFLENPPTGFGDANRLGKVENVTIVQGSILSEQTVARLSKEHYGLVFSAAVLEQLNNFIDVALGNIFSLDMQHFLFHEQWLEANSRAASYGVLVHADYFRSSLRLLNKFPVELLDFSVPPIQPSHMNYGSAFGVRTTG